MSRTNGPRPNSAAASRSGSRRPLSVGGAPAGVPPVNHGQPQQLQAPQQPVNFFPPLNEGGPEPMFAQPAPAHSASSSSSAASSGAGCGNDFRICSGAMGVGSASLGPLVVESDPEECMESELSDSNEFVATSLFSDTFHQFHDLYQTESLCDIELVIGPKNIKCHKVLLACVSAYFKTMFQSEMVESKQSTVVIQDLDPDSVEALIKFCYTSKLHLTIDNVQSLFYAASILQMEVPAKACSDFMLAHLDTVNCIGVRDFGEAHGRHDLISFTQRFMEEHFYEVCNQEDFLNISINYLAQMLCSENLNVKDETQVYEAAIRWISHDLTERTQYLPRLLELIRLPLLPPEYLLKVVSRNELVRSNLQCRDLVDDCKGYHMTPHHQGYEMAAHRTPRKSYAGIIFCVGGRGSFGDPFKSVECYDIRTNEWFAVSDMSTKRRHVGVVSVGEKLYAIGGHDGNRHLNTAEVFDPRTNKWSPMAPMNALRRGLAVACLRGTIYALGGLDDQTCYRAVERYDAEANAWSQVQPLNIPRGGVAVATVTDVNTGKDYLYAVGGNDGSASLDSCERYDPLLNKWTMVASMSKRRAGAGCSELNGYIYVVGGFDDNAPLDSAERFDPLNNQWSAVSKMSCPRGGVGVATLAGKLFAVGGHDGTSYLNTAEAYDIALNRWFTIGSVGSCRAGAGTAFCNVPIFEVAKAKQEKAKTPTVNSCV